MRPFFQEESGAEPALRFSAAPKPLAAAPRNPDRRSPKRGGNHAEHHRVVWPRQPWHGVIIFWVYRARACVFGRRAGGRVCARAGQRQTQAGESSRLTEKRRTLKRRLSTAVNLRETRMVSKT